MIDYNSYIIDLERRFHEKTGNKSVLIEETFVLWYILNEGIICENFGEEELEKRLKRNFEILTTQFNKDPEVNFILGWMLSISFWYFGDIDEDLGQKKLYQAYQSNKDNMLFKWAVRDLINLSTHEVEIIEIKWKTNFKYYFSCNGLIENYFMGL